ncbi:MAG: hypothetical protein ACRDRX_25580 [Pseudonocardiaceae bacterium]
MFAFVAQREARNLCYFRSPYSVGFEPTMFFMGTQELLDVKVRALKCFGPQQQIDMNGVELFSIARRVEFADQIVVG